jgi:Arc/MetJ family transcription regulator
LLLRKRFSKAGIRRDESEERLMARTNIELDDALIAKAMRLTGARTKREAVDIALRCLVKKEALYRAALRLRGKLIWEGDVDASRASRTSST